MAKNNSYLDNMTKNYGDNWIVTVTPDNIQRSAKRVFKDMVRGSIDYQKLGKYFLDGKFIDNLIIACSNELEINTVYYNAMCFYIQYNPNIPNLNVHANHLGALCYIYQVILNKLNSVKSTGNIGFLADTSSLLYTYKNHLN